MYKTLSPAIFPCKHMKKLKQFAMFWLCRKRLLHILDIFVWTYERSGWLSPRDGRIICNFTPYIRVLSQSQHFLERDTLGRRENLNYSALPVMDDSYWCYCSLQLKYVLQVDRKRNGVNNIASGSTIRQM